MLAKMRGGLDSIFVNILLGVLIAAFAIWGIGPSVFGGNTNVVATVGDAEISRIDYELTVRRQARNLQAQFQSDMSAEQIITTFGLDRQVVQQMITQAAYVEDGKALGLRASDAQVAKDLGAIEAFQLGGVFSRETMRQVLNQNQMNEKKFLQDIASDIPRRHLVQSLVATSPIPRKMAEILYRHENELRTATMMNIAAADITDIAFPTDEELNTSYEDGKSAFMTSEKRSYNYLLLTPAAFIKDATATVDDAQAIYDSRIDDFVTAEKRTILGATFTSKKHAEDFITQVKAGADFATTAASMTEFTAEEISLGDVTKAGLEIDYSAETATAVFDLPFTGEITSALEGLAGWDVFSVVNIVTGQEQPFDQVKSTLLEEARAENATDLMYDLINILQDDLATGITLDELVTKHKLELAVVTAVDKNGSTEGGAPIVTTAEGRTILATAYNLEEGEDPELLDVDAQDASKGMYLTAVTEITAPVQKTFEVMKDTISAQMIAERKLQAAGEIAEKMLARLNAGEEADAIVNSLGGTSYTAKNITRNMSEKSSVSQSIRDLLFSFNVGEADLDRSADGDGYIIIRADKIKEADVVKDEFKVDALQEILEQSVPNDLLQQYQANLTAKMQPTINHGLIQQLFQVNQ